MDWYEEEVRALERLHETAPSPPGSVLFYGSSSFRLWSTLSADLASWPVVNRAFGGSTLAACVHFFERLAVPCAPASIVCYAGDNDLGDGRTHDDIVASFHALLTKISRLLGPIPVAFLSIKPSPARWELRDRIAGVNREIRRVLNNRSCGYYVDVYHPMLGQDGRPRAELFDADGLHLSAEGYRLWTSILCRYRDALLTRDARFNVRQ